ncbi:AAA family ATPase [Deinococcus detaillensis]|uniref:AAA family ATPase n=1 Tax=Deinococcus detaillensis TaxID=2592048 RepID=A0A553UH64_9DEIO|nr:AAA family ATPase [Deinococcus detaillensis]TSA79547.1 AAA family ATPase [Deinococcus detaillensis]
MLYLVGGIKGGSGKTTVAVNLAVGLMLAGRDILLVDADDQETATDFCEWRNQRTEGNAGFTAIQLSGQAARNEILRLAEKYQDVVIDTGGRDTNSQRAALTVADVYLVPFNPRSFDIWTISKVSKLVEEAQHLNPNLKAYVFLNRADARGSDNDDAAEALKEVTALTYLDVSLGNRKAYANAATQGMGVMELQPEDKKASAEFAALFNLIIDFEKNVESKVRSNVKSDVKVKG